MPLQENEVQWVVNNLGEIGVKIEDRIFFCYKGESFLYRSEETHISDNASVRLRWRTVGKRELGETLMPPAIEGGQSPEEYFKSEHKVAFIGEWQDFPKVSFGC
jgi:hypothetical protein